MYRRKSILIVALLVITLFFFTLQYLQLLLPTPKNTIKFRSEIEDLIYQELQELDDKYNVPQRLVKVEEFLGNINNFTGFTKIELLSELWKEANFWPSAQFLTNISSTNIGTILNALKRTRIIKADLDNRGTQLKLLLTLLGGQQCIFKPKWYDKEKIIEGPVYAGKDRYGSEIVAFYLSVLLNKPLVPVSVERNISLKYDVLPVARMRLLNTSFEKEDKRVCIYGKCFYCKPADPICDNTHNMLTGALIFNIKKTFSNYRSPWQRTYKKGKNAIWQDDQNYCRSVKSKLNKKRILDLIDTAIFDFLIQNGDRHHYETLDDKVVWLDNGKGFGNPNVQHIDILAPLYQCCIIRESTWTSLQNLSGKNLVRYMKLMPNIENVLTEQHLKAMEERLFIIYATVQYCRKKKSGNKKISL
ncbi:hypothetical protein ABEB36_007177 [Hypothenemus hampei]|uniref:FAM20 C-terminal domain-containing protein n=1 Tax=Hypothenemus hampei TaxID=57062 RepID=A0ABD1ET69_HYPHA